LIRCAGEQDKRATVVGIAAVSTGQDVELLYAVVGKARLVVVGEDQ
jgi:hypothetical protein